MSIILQPSSHGIIRSRKGMEQAKRLGQVCLAMATSLLLDDLMTDKFPLSSLPVCVCSGIPTVDHHGLWMETLHGLGGALHHRLLGLSPLIAPTASLLPSSRSPYYHDEAEHKRSTMETALLLVRRA